MSTQSHSDIPAIERLKTRAQFLAAAKGRSASRVAVKPARMPGCPSRGRLWITTAPRDAERPLAAATNWARVFSRSIAGMSLWDWVLIRPWGRW